MLTCVTRDPIEAKARWYARFLRGVDVASVSYRDHMLQLRDRAHQIISSITINEISNLSLLRGVLSNELIVTTKNRRRWRCRALQKSESREIRQAVAEHKRIVSAEPVARELAQQIEVADQTIADMLSGKRYLRRSEADDRLTEVKILIGKCDLYVRLCFIRTSDASAPTRWLGPKPSAVPDAEVGWSSRQAARSFAVPTGHCANISHHDAKFVTGDTL